MYEPNDDEIYRDTSDERLDMQRRLLKHAERVLGNEPNEPTLKESVASLLNHIGLLNKLDVKSDAEDPSGLLVLSERVAAVANDLSEIAFSLRNHAREALGLGPARDLC